jgi:hypothetical protein
MIHVPQKLLIDVTHIPLKLVYSRRWSFVSSVLRSFGALVSVGRVEHQDVPMRHAHMKAGGLVL